MTVSQAMISTSDQGCFIGTRERNNQSFPAKLAGLNYHGKYAVKRDEGSSSTDATDENDFFSYFDSGFDLFRFYQQAYEHG